MTTPYSVVQKALRSQGARHSRPQLEALTAALMAGESPKTYGERVAQMALDMAGLLPKFGIEIEPGPADPDLVEDQAKC